MPPDIIQPVWDSLPIDQKLKFEAYATTLTKWQKSINLVSPNTLPHIKERHILDSYQLIQHIPSPVKTIYDLGSGAGFPALVIAIARPDLDIHCIESDQRKCEFIKTISRENDIPVTVHMGRIESFQALAAPDLITARALSGLKNLLDWTEFWRNGAKQPRYLLPKGGTWQQEIKEAKTDYSFDYKDYPSATDPAARLLLVDNILK